MLTFTETGIWVTDSKKHHVVDDGLASYISKLITVDAFKNVIAVPRLYDYGCGTGGYCKYLSSHNITTLGIDGNPNSKDIEEVPIKVHDLTTPLDIDPVPYGISIEVGNHIPESLYDKFMENILGRTSSLLIMSWAKPGQGGENQLNRKDFDSLSLDIYQRGWEVDYECTYKARRSASYVWIKDTVAVYRKRF